MAEKDILHAALEKIQQHRYSDSSLYLADIAASLAWGGNHRRVDLSRFPLLDEEGRRIAFDLITAKVKNSPPTSDRP